jgi:predicted PurR-regulated permease PerM
MITASPPKALALGMMGAIGAGLGWFVITGALPLVPIVVDCLLALFAALAIEPAVRWARERGVHRWVTVTAIASGLVLCGMALAMWIIPVVTVQLTELFRILPQSPEQFLESPFGIWLQSVTPAAIDLRQVTGNVLAWATGPATLEVVGGGTLVFGGTVAATMLNAGLTAVLALYASLTLPAIRGAALACVSATRRRRVGAVADEAAAAVGKYVLGHLLLAALNGGFVTLLVALVGGPTPLLFGVISGVSALVPVVGTLLGGTVAAVATLGVSLPAGITVAIVMIVYMQVESYVILPRVMSRAVSVPGSLTIIGAVAGAAVGGVLGAFMALPILSAAMVVFRRVYLPRQQRR